MSNNMCFIALNFYVNIACYTQFKYSLRTKTADVRLLDLLHNQVLWYSVYSL